MHFFNVSSSCVVLSSSCRSDSFSFPMISSEKEKDGIPDLQSTAATGSLSGSGREGAGSGWSWIPEAEAKNPFISGTI